MGVGYPKHLVFECPSRILWFWLLWTIRFNLFLPRSNGILFTYHLLIWTSRIAEASTGFFFVVCKSTTLVVLLFFVVFFLYVFICRPCYRILDYNVCLFCCSRCKVWAFLCNQLWFPSISFEWKCFHYLIFNEILVYFATNKKKGCA